MGRKREEMGEDGDDKTGIVMGMGTNWVTVSNSSVDVYVDLAVLGQTVLGLLNELTSC